MIRRRRHSAGPECDRRASRCGMIARGVNRSSGLRLARNGVSPLRSSAPCRPNQNASRDAGASRSELVSAPGAIRRRGLALRRTGAVRPSLLRGRQWRRVGWSRGRAPIFPAEEHALPPRLTDASSCDAPVSPPRRGSRWSEIARHEPYCRSCSRLAPEADRRGGVPAFSEMLTSRAAAPPDHVSTYLGCCILGEHPLQVHDLDGRRPAGGG